MQTCEALREGNINCDNDVMDEDASYCVEHLHLEELMEDKFDLCREQWRKYRKKYIDSDKKRHKEQVRKANKKYRESGKAQAYEKSQRGKDRKRRYRKKVQHLKKQQT